MRCASLAQAGQVEDARSFLRTLRLEQSQLSIQWLRHSVPYQTSELLQRYVEGMQKAGLEEA